MDCDHCLRGNVQNCDIDNKYIEAVFKKIDSIQSLSITGGEPSLVPEKIFFILEIAKKYKVDIGGFYIATNGKKISNEFIRAIFELYMYCDDKEEGCILNYSNDQYHGYCIEDENEYQRSISMLKAFSFTSTKYDSSEMNKNEEINENRMLPEGKAINNFSAYGKRDIDIYSLEIEEDCIIGDIYLNCKGNILPHCDLSYETQDIDFLIIGNIIDIDFIKNTEKFNTRLENLGVNKLQDIKDKIEEMEIEGVL